MSILWIYGDKIGKDWGTEVKRATHTSALVLYLGPGPVIFDACVPLLSQSACLFQHCQIKVTRAEKKKKILKEKYWHICLHCSALKVEQRKQNLISDLSVMFQNLVWNSLTKIISLI